MPADRETSILVLGGGIAGLLVTAAARRAGHTVVLIEQRPHDRSVSAVPHANQLHNLLGRAQRSIEALLPGFSLQVADFGGIRGSVSRSTHVHEIGRRMPSRDLGRELWSISRMDLELALRSREETTPDVLIEARVDDVVLDGSECRGVLVSDPGGRRRVESALTVDCLGAANVVPASIERNGGNAIPYESLPVRQWYATAQIRPACPTTDFWLTFPFHGTRGGLASPALDGHMRVSLNGGPNDNPPRDEAAFRSYARRLPDDGIACLLDGGTIGRIDVFQKPLVRWNRYDRASVLGLVAVGDASACLNPLFGQGVSGAAWEAELLARALMDDRQASTYTTRSAHARQAMWDLMTVHEPTGSVTLSDDQWRDVGQHVLGDADLHRAYVDVWHLLAPVASLSQIARGDLPDPSTWEEEWR